MVTPDTPADATDASAEQVLVQRHGARVDIVLNRPQQHNAMTPAMYGALTQAFRELADDIDARVVVLRGAGGRAFAAGNDIAGFAGRSGAEIVADYESRVMGMLDALFALPQVTIAAVEGICVGGGLAVATCCDVRLATADARFGYPIARTLGNALSRSVLARCRHVFGESLTRAMLLTSQLVDARRAYDVGAVLQVAQDSQALTNLLDQVADGVVRSAPVTIEVTKAQLAELTSAGTAPEAELLRAVYSSPGFAEGVRAFLAKESPAFPPERLGRGGG
ncbi:enoyl-CoA hydratase/carnithine racemase [Kineosphaera limosa]|uniref:Putative enoyl-CoA hydratase n=1 Tax=Kineosphaera limosa NBRC 100340 TaxID=1184609 RepID=K6W4R8_9MICO|nr:enoyl-CoA hydratase-related protein [Kineosphaera limosa]NYE02300.1 enoyl-CoA hydratase/carnithine racemase [Kineosphaera limosa]GAB94155.1 putative enoyl-CoA hydratase [Kineosphaera limosa NBRC 100340]